MNLILTARYIASGGSKIDQILSVRIYNVARVLGSVCKG